MSRQECLSFSKNMIPGIDRGHLGADTTSDAGYYQRSTNALARQDVTANSSTKDYFAMTLLSAKSMPRYLKSIGQQVLSLLAMTPSTKIFSSSGASQRS